MVFYCREGGGILENNHPRTHRHIQLFVGIDGDRVGLLDAGKQTAIAVGEEGRSAPGGIHVEVAAQLRSQVGQGLQGVDVPGLGGAGDADQAQGADALGLRPGARSIAY